MRTINQCIYFVIYFASLNINPPLTLPPLAHQPILSLHAFTHPHTKSWDPYKLFSLFSSSNHNPTHTPSIQSKTLPRTRATNLGLGLHDSDICHQNHTSLRLGFFLRFFGDINLILKLFI